MRGSEVPMVFEEYEKKKETFLERYQRRIVENPFLAAGLGGLGTMLVVGASKYKSLRATGMSPSVFLINLRVAAQGTLVATLGIGVLAQFLAESWKGSSDSSKKS